MYAIWDGIKYEEKREIAILMLEDHMDIELVTKYCCLTKKQMIALKGNLVF